MSENELATGDVVSLKSGGIIMTVMSVSDNSARCVWFDENTSDVHEWTFLKDCLASLGNAKLVVG
jgi:uncharacterized protein YodC (DUF2158 family)